MAKGKPSETDIRNAKDSRLVAVVLVGTMAFWLIGQGMGGHFGWPTRFVFLFDLAALAGFFWTMVVTYRIWRRMKSDAGGN